MQDYVKAFQQTNEYCLNQAEKMSNLTEVICDLSMGVYDDYSSFRTGCLEIMPELINQGVSFSDEISNAFSMKIDDATETLVINLLGADDVIETQIINISTILADDIDLSDIKLTITEGIDSSFCTLSDVMYSLSDTSKFYEVIDQVTDQVLSDEQVTVQQVQSLIDSVDPSGSIESIQDMKASFISAAQGYIDGVSWLTYLRNNFSAIKGGLDSGTLELDTSYGGVNQWFSSRIIAGYAQSVGWIVNNTVSVVSDVLRGIIVAIDKTVSSVFSSLTDYEVNDKAVTAYVDYPISAKSGTVTVHYVPNKDGNLNLLSTPFMDSYEFKNPDGTYSRNSFIKVGIKPSYLVSLLSDVHLVDVDIQSDTVTISTKEDRSWAQTLDLHTASYQHEEDYFDYSEAIKTNSSIHESITTAMLCYFLFCNSAETVTIPKTGFPQIGDVPQGVYANESMALSYVDSFEEKMFLVLFNRYMVTPASRNLNIQEETYCFNWFRAIEAYAEYQGVGLMPYLSMVYDSEMFWVTRNSFMVFSPSFIPTSRAILFPKTTGLGLVLAAAGLVLLGFVAGGIIRRFKLRRMRRTIRRETKGKKKINQKKAVFDATMANPQATAAQKAAAEKAYAKATVKYNRKAQLFGRRTYDPVNGLYSQSASASTNAAGAGILLRTENLKALITG